MKKQYLKLSEAAAELNIHVNTLKGIIHRGRITPNRFAERVIRIKRSELERYQRETLQIKV